MKLLGILSIYLWFWKFFWMDDVTVISNLPAELISGQRHLIEVVISKGDLIGFSKLELSLPTGFSALPADIQGASFTFSGGRARFVWMEMPAEDVFTVSYYLESEKGKEGHFEISGLFSYVGGNIRRDIAIPSKQIKVSPHREVNMDVYDLKDELELLCERSVTRLNEREFEVKLKVSNNSIQGFGKILEKLPAGCVTRKLNDGGSVVTQDGNTIKFVWFEVPDAKNFEVSYLVSCPTDCESLPITGEISYTENRKPYTIDIVEVVSASTFQMGIVKDLESRVNRADNGVSENEQISEESGNAVTGDDTAVQPKSVNTALIEPLVSNLSSVAQNNEKEIGVSNIEKSTKNEEVLTEVRNVEANETKPVRSFPVTQPSQGISYSVQILAAHRVVEKTYFTARHQFSGDFNIEHHEGWVKYTTGRYDEYSSARAARTEVSSSSKNLPGPFVTAYQDGNRITVQEALLITHQRWTP